MKARSLLFLLVALLLAASASANTFDIALTVNFADGSATAGIPVEGGHACSANAFPPDPCRLDGTAQLYTGPTRGGFLSPFASFSINGLLALQSVQHTFPPNPCASFDGDACQLGIGFGGNTQMGDGSVFPTFFFTNDNIPSASPGAPPILPIGELGTNFGPVPPPIRGAIVMFDSPVQVGTWQLTITEVPEPASLLLVATGIAGIAARRRRG